MAPDQTGAILDSGLSDWQIIQQSADGTADIPLAGHWIDEPGGRVQVRLVSEATGQAVAARLDWQDASTSVDGAWQALLHGVPAGGLYRLETRYNPAGNLAGEWSPRGDMRHFVGVGDLWVIAGQSNSAGYGKGPVYDSPELGIHLFANSGRWALASQPLNESTDTAHAVNREAANPGHSPYLHFGRLLKERLGYPIGLVQTALGGSALAPWNPIETKSAVLYENMLHCIEQAGGRVRGILWYQGETDATPEQAPTYAERFCQAVRAWRAALGQPELPMLTVQLNRYYTPPTPELELGWSLLREAQRRVPAMLSGVAVVPTLDLPLGDLIHTSAQGNLLLAQRLADAALGCVYGLPVAWRAPDIASARYAAEAEVVLTFDHVTSRMENPDLTTCCFAVQDEAGSVPIAQVRYPGDATVRLDLGRPLRGEARVDGAPGLGPPPVPMDMERLMPMLAFSNQPIQR